VANVEIHFAAIQHRQASRYMQTSDGHSILAVRNGRAMSRARGY
jgi:hypothetical protein